MASIAFMGKVERVECAGGENAYEYIKIPKLTRKHCDMSAFRVHAKYGGFANSALFAAILVRIRKEIFGDAEVVKLHDIPSGVSVDTSNFLAVVSFEV